MSQLIRLQGDAFVLAEDRFTAAPDDDVTPPGDVIVSFTRFQSEAGALLGPARQVGVRIEAGQSVDDLAYDLPRLAVVALAFPKFGDGRAYSSAALLRGRYGFAGEIRAVGDVLREQAGFMVRCGFDAFEPADGSTPEQWAAAAGRFRHVYQRAADDRAPAFAERAGGFGANHGLRRV
ncbi:MAG TPA: DUF934 domain-containing protein [Caulobacteraceae bacterium]|jgi:uncharacterized protein (DUF934 family)|nr:DUF934 domain-containing protein [Caulobacteraceae bacterium]